METKQNDKNQQNILQMLMFRYFPYWPLFLVLSVFMLAVAWAYLKVTPSVYESTATILINDEKKGVENSAAIESLSGYTSKKIVENEIEVIKSKTLMLETVEKLNLSAPVHEKHLFSRVDAYTSSPIVVEIKDIEKIKEAKRVDFEYVDIRQEVLCNKMYYPINEWISFPFGEIRFVKNPHLINQASGKFYFSLTDPMKVVNALLKDLNVSSASKLSTVVDLSIRDQVPVRGNFILNTLLDSYSKAGLDDKNRLAANTLRFVEDRIKLIEHDLDSIEYLIQQFKSSRGVVDLSAQGKLFLQNVGENDQKLAQINMQMAMLSQVESYMLNNTNQSGIVTSSLGILDETLSAMVNKLYDAENRYEQLKNTTAENSPILIALQNQIQKMRPSILDYVRNQRNNLQASKSDLSSTNDRYSSVLQAIPQKERRLLEVTRQQVIKNNVYTFLLQKREETALSFGSTVGDTRLIDKAVSSTNPVSPQKAILFPGAVVLAFLMVIIWITFKELLSSKLLFRSAIESATSIPVVAEISHSNLREYIVIGNDKRPFLTEQFRHLRSAVGLFGKTKKKTLLITSSISGEGKSFISANFATSLARSKKRVLLLDFDLRNPQLTYYFKAHKKVGIAEYLLGANTVEEAVHETSTPNLFFLGAGQEVRNPIEILLNGDLDALFDELRQLFDFIIIDTAPVDPVSDAFVISPYCDVTLFVMRHGKTPKKMVQLLDDNNKIKALKNTSIVFNGVKVRGFVKDSFGFGYGSEQEYRYPDRTL